MAHSKIFVTGCAAILVALLAVACAGQPSQEQTTTPSDQTGQQAAPADPAAGQAAPAQGTAPAEGQTPAQGEQPQN